MVDERYQTDVVSLIFQPHLQPAIVIVSSPAGQHRSHEVRQCDGGLARTRGGPANESTQEARDGGHPARAQRVVKEREFGAEGADGAAGLESLELLSVLLAVVSLRFPVVSKEKRNRSLTSSYLAQLDQHEFLAKSHRCRGGSLLA